MQLEDDHKHHCSFRAGVNKQLSESGQSKGISAVKKKLGQSFPCWSRRLCPTSCVMCECTQVDTASVRECGMGCRTRRRCVGVHSACGVAQPMA
jgi:hypothetical protein